MSVVVHRGFSLVELIITILIIGVLAALAAPRFFSRTVFAERVYAAEVLQALRYARRSAEAANCSVAFSFTAQGFTLNYNAACATGGATSYTLSVPDPLETGQPLASNARPATMMQSSTPTTFVFLPQGGVVNTSGASVSPVVTLGGAEYSASITIHSVTGYAVQN